MGLYKNNTVNPPIFLVDKPLLTNNQKFHKNSYLLDYIKEQKEYNMLLFQHINKQREEIIDSLSLRFDKQEKTTQHLLKQTDNQEAISNLISKQVLSQIKANDSLTAIINKQREEIIDSLSLRFDKQEKTTQHLLKQTDNQEAISNLISKQVLSQIEANDSLTAIINKQKEEIIDFLSLHFDEQENSVEEAFIKDYFTLGDHIEVLYGTSSPIDGIFIDIRHDTLIWIDSSKNLCLSNIKGIGIKKKVS